jgi:triphosphoribosyl-dephospho-CoA synthase
VTAGDRSTVENAQLALLLEVSGTPKPGNVDRVRDHGDLTYDAFLAGAVGAREGLAAALGGPIGPAFEEAVAGMAHQRAGNTQFGALLLLVPLVRAAAAPPSARDAGAAPPTPERADQITAETTVDDAAAFYRAFDHVDVAVGPPPGDVPDVRDGSDAVPAVREAGLALRDVMAGSEGDDDAREWTEGFPRTFRIADRLASMAKTDAVPPDGTTPSDLVARAYLEALARRPDSLVAVEHGPDTAERVRQRAADLTAHGTDVEDPAIADFAEDLVERGINPGTTADCVAAGTFVALERGALRV